MDQKRNPLWRLMRTQYRKSMRRVWRWTHPHRKSRDVLLVCNCGLMATYLQPVFEALRDDPRIRWRLMLPDGEQREGDFDMARRLLPVPEVSVRWAHTRMWDLVIKADHVYHELCAPNGYSTIYVPHGKIGKSFDGQNYRYGDFAFDKAGRPKYSAVLEHSECDREQAIKQNPALADVISVVGSLMDDRIFNAARRRESIRREMGFSPAETVVFVTGTWGENNIFRRMGDELLDEMRALQNEFRFVLSAHPHEYRPRSDGGRVWGSYLRTQKKHGFIVREPEESWIPYMVAADIVLCDQTSMSLYAALLNKPVIFANLDETQLVEGSATWRLFRFAPNLPRANRLEEYLQNAKQNYPREQMKELAARLNSCPGEAEERARKLIYQLLDLSDPYAKAESPAAVFSSGPAA